MKKKRPLGITILAIIYLILGVLSLIWSMLVFGVGGLTAGFSSLFGMENLAAAGSSSFWSGGLGILAAIVQLVVGVGLLRLSRWAWYLALIAVALTLIQGAVGLFSGGMAAFICGGIGLVIPLVILIYLISARVKEVFDIS